MPHQVRPALQRPKVDALRVCVITAEELARTHGVGAQLLKMYSGIGDFFHFHWQSYHGTDSEHASSYKLAEWPVGIRGLRRLSRTAQKISGTAWWRDSRINVKRFQRLMLGVERATVAHIVIADEDSASRALSLVQALDCPYVLQIYDLYYKDGISETQHPNCVQMIRGAACVFALTPSLQRECSRFRKEVLMIGIGVEPYNLALVDVQPELPIRVVLTGRPYPRGCSVLLEALCQWPSLVDPIEVHYVGAHFRRLPPTLQRRTRNWGFCSSDIEYHNLLSTMSVGYLTGPDENDEYGKFSFPSRAADLLMAGLPLIACVRDSSATASVFEGVQGSFFSRVENASDLHKMIELTTIDHLERRRAARNFAERHFSIAVNRDKLLEQLQKAMLQRAE